MSNGYNVRARHVHGLWELHIDDLVALSRSRVHQILYPKGKDNP